MTIARGGIGLSPASIKKPGFRQAAGLFSLVSNAPEVCL